MKRSVALGLLTGAVVGWGFVEPWLLQVRRFDVALENLPPGAEGMRIVQVSDLHAGLVTPMILTRHILQLAQKENADLIVLTGDVVSRARSYLPPIRPPAPPITEYARRLEPLMRELHAPLGVIAIPGNHDLMFNSENPNPKKRGDFAPVATYLESAGIQILDNANMRLANGLAVIGTDDLREGIPDVRAAVEGIAPHEAQLVLNHNPRIAALFADRNALILSGHTHGGQAKLPAPLRLNPIDSISSPWQSGWWRVGRAQLYVSTGAGHIGGPYRLGVPPEISVFTLLRAKPGDSRTLPI
ncbi:hypothetical protein EON83_18815 [bacterium]|nr:MAG: hypothetical protein EON83_18815 [bacterium]